VTDAGGPADFALPY
jgi:hypothetical protein